MCVNLGSSLECRTLGSVIRGRCCICYLKALYYGRVHCAAFVEAKQKATLSGLWNDLGGPLLGPRM